jgi:hypothetical protein
MRAVVAEGDVPGVYVEKEQSKHEQNQNDAAEEPEDEKEVGFIGSYLFNVHTCVMAGKDIWVLSHGDKL